jgi:hypothetical protein
VTAPFTTSPFQGQNLGFESRWGRQTVTPRHSALYCAATCRIETRRFGSLWPRLWPCLPRLLHVLGIPGDRATDLGVAHVPVAIEHPQRRPAGQELNHARVDAVLQHQRDAGVPHGVVTDVGQPEGLDGADHANGKQLPLLTC